MANGDLSYISQSYEMNVQLGKLILPVQFYYLPCLAVPVLLGLDAARKFGVGFNAQSERWWVAGAAENQYPFLNLSAPEKEADPPLACGIQGVSLTKRQILDRVVQDGLDLLKNSPGLTTAISYKINVGSNPPVKQRPYQYSPKVLEAMYRELDRLLEDGLVEPSHSPWASPVVMVPKGKGDYRFCIDFRRVNLSRKDSYPMPNMSRLLDSLRKARFLSKMDLKQAFLQVPLADEASKDITSFIVPGRGLFRYKVMPFGLTGAPATFQRLADSVFGPELFPEVVVFLDDNLICSSNFESQCRAITEVFKRLKLSGFKINPEKCEFGCREVHYLGYRININGMSVDPEKVAPVLSFPRPKTAKGIRRFLGMASWYRRFVPDFSTLVTPLTSLLKKGGKWHWSQAQESSFRQL
jgi:hypothetical protein